MFELWLVTLLGSQNIFYEFLLVDRLKIQNSCTFLSSLLIELDELDESHSVCPACLPIFVCLFLDFYFFGVAVYSCKQLFKIDLRGLIEHSLTSMEVSLMLMFKITSVLLINVSLVCVFPDPVNLEIRALE